MGTIVAIHVPAFEYNLYSSGDDTMVQQRSDCRSVCYFVGTIGGEEEQKGLSHRLATVGLVRRGGPKVSPRAFLSIFPSIDLPPAIGRTR